MLIWSKEAFISALSLSLAHSLWQGALVGAVAAALHSRLKRATADVRYATCGLLLLTLVIAWLGSLACLYATEARHSPAWHRCPVLGALDHTGSTFPSAEQRSANPDAALVRALSRAALDAGCLAALHTASVEPAGTTALEEGGHDALPAGMAGANQEPRRPYGPAPGGSGPALHTRRCSPHLWRAQIVSSAASERPAGA